MSAAASSTAYVCRCGRRESRFVATCGFCGLVNACKRVEGGDEPTYRDDRRFVPATGVPRHLKLAAPADDDVEETEEDEEPGARIRSLHELGDDVPPRMPTGIKGLDLVLGGPKDPGPSEGTLLLFSGDRGVGKSTLICQAALGHAEHLRTLYGSFEEASRSVNARARRLGATTKQLKRLFIVDDEQNPEHDLEFVLKAAIRLKARALVIDSLQTTRLLDVEGVIGGDRQVKACAERLYRFTHGSDIVVYLICHMTKGGTVAGPGMAHHAVDGIFLASHVNTSSGRRVKVHCDNKNRFGPNFYSALFQMTEDGLIPAMKKKAP